MFNLEKEINKWRKTLDKNHALEDGYKEELLCHLRDKIEYLKSTGLSEKKAFAEAAHKIGRADSIGAEYFKTDTRQLSGQPPWEKRRFMPFLLQHYFKVALRKLKRHTVFSLINITGLAVGLACCAVIILYVTNELTYDSFHPDSERIYRVASHRISRVGEHYFVTTPGPLGPTLKNSYSQVENAVRVIPPYENSDNVLVVKGEDRWFETRVWFADADIFEVFRMPFITGGPQQALKGPNKVVLTQDMADKYFDGEPPLGKILRIEIDYDTGRVELQDYEVTGVIKNAPANTHFKYDILLSMDTMAANFPNFEEDWINPHSKYTYVKLNADTTAADFDIPLQQMAAIGAKKYNDRFDRFLKLYEFFLQPVTRIHMHSRHLGEISPPGNWYYLYIYSIVALLILLIGCMNFINLSAALSSTRTKEVGMRKIVGAHNRQLLGQFLGESFIITGLAFIVAVWLISLLLIPFNQMAGTELSLAGLKQPIVLFSMLGLLLLVSIGSGSYPAFILTAFKPSTFLQGKSTPKARGSLLQKFLVVGQFAISIFLVICTLIVFSQLKFMRGRALGFDMQQKLILRVKSNMRHFRVDYETIKKDFLQHPNIIGATVSSSVPGDITNSGYYLSSKGEDFSGAAWLKVITMDHDFIPQYDIQMIAGRAFQRGEENDENGAFIINTAALKALGFTKPEEALHKSFLASYNRKNKKIVGITDDFHYRGMREQVEPLVMDIENSLFNSLTLTVEMKNIPDVMKFIRQKWEAHFPGVPFDFAFLDENFDREYRYEEQMSRLLGIITTLGFFIACLGLFGLASFVVQYRRKEIGIRKVLGASVADIVSMLSKKFTLLILLAIAVASPLAFFSMKKWLQDFAYRTSIGAEVFIIAAAGAIIIALATVCLQGIRAASANPVTSLRDE